MRDYIVVVEVVRAAGRWWIRLFTPDPSLHGPFDDPEIAETRLFRCWRERARAVGGCMWIPVKGQWGVTLPSTVETALPPMSTTACTRGA